MLGCARDHDLAGTKSIASVDDVNPGREPGQIKRLFEGRVATAHDGDFLVPEEEPVAGCAGTYAATPQPRLGFEPSQRAEAPVATMTASA